MARTGRLLTRTLPVILLALFVAIAWRGVPSDDSLLALEGRTMGTTYRILVHRQELPTENSRRQLGEAIDRQLYRLDRELMSTFSPDSQLSHLNSLAPGTSLVVAPELLTVIAAAGHIHEASGGAFDITVKPLVDLWGFGTEKPPDSPPADEAIAAARAVMGLDKLLIDTAAQSISRTAPVSLDLSAIAKGFAVDEVATLLELEGLDDYLVEIGGEVLSRGERPDGSPWRLGIETPATGEPSLFQIIRTDGTRLAVATSGNYRNFYLADGQRYGHTIDPATGRPVTHDLASVTVVAGSAMLADAWATALMVKGPDAGMKLANELQLAAYFIKAGAGQFSTAHSQAFARYLPDSP